MDGPKKDLEIFETEDPVEQLGLGKVFTKKTSEVHTDKSVLDQSTVPAREAFLKFQRDAIAQDQDRSRFFHRNLTFGGTRRTEVEEDPLTKFTRLQAELSDFQHELQSLASKGEQAKDVFTSIKTQEATELSASVHALSTYLEQLGKSEAFKPFLAPTFDGHSTIASQSLLQKIKEVKSAGTTSSKSGDDGEPKQQQEDRPAGVTYELFFNKALQKEQGNSSLNALENRLYQLEQMVGLKSFDVNSAGTPSPLSNVMSKLEDRVRLLDPKTLSRLHAKMEELNKEFEAFTAKRNKAKVARVQLTDDIQRERVDTLFNTVQQWAPVADTIPTLVSRMQTLKTLHEESALFSQRLFGLETMQDGLMKMLRESEKSLMNVEQSLVSNMETVGANVSAVDARLEEVTKKVDSQ